MFGSSLPPFVCMRVMPYLRYLCLFAHSGVQHMCFCFVSLRLVFVVLPVYMDYPFLISPSIFSKIYLVCKNIQIIVFVIIIK